MPGLKRVNLLKIPQFFFCYQLTMSEHVASEFFVLGECFSNDIQWFECSINITGSCYPWLQLA